MASPSTSVTEADLRAFKASPLMRRFPELKSFPDSDLSQMVAYEKGFADGKLESPTKTYPKTDFSSTARCKAPTGQTPIFYPVNATQAKEQAKRPDGESFLTIGTPYNADHTQLLEDKSSDESKRSPLAFKPTSTSEARKPISLRGVF